MLKSAFSRLSKLVKKWKKTICRKYKKEPKRVITLGILFLFSVISLVSFISIPKENDDIFFLKSNENAILANENPSFRVDFGKRNSPETQWVRFEAKASSKNPFEQEKGSFFTKILNWIKPKKEYGIEMSLRGAKLGETEKLELEGKEEIVKTVADIIGTDTVKTTTELVDSGRIIGEYTDEAVSKKTVINKDVAEGVDIEYQILKGLGLKEEIVIKDLEEYSKDCSEDLEKCKVPLNEFVFDFKLDDGLVLSKGWFTLKGVSTETYYFKDSDGNYVAHFLPNWAIDSAGERTNSVSLSVDEKEGGNYEVRVIVDLQWLLSKERIYPVRIDPSVVHDTKGKFDAGIFNNTESLEGPKVQIKNPTGYPVDANTVGYWKMDTPSYDDGFDATGGTVTYTGEYTVHTFTSSGTFTVNSGSRDIEYLVVGGGGGGGGSNGAGGGGGGGGVVSGTGLSVTSQVYTVTVGNGGVGSGPTAGSGSKGGDSSFGSLVTATGGGGGGGYNGTSTTAPGSGGSGGGGGSSGTGSFTGASGTSGQGYAGGNGLSTGTVTDQAGAGGGGAAATGTASTGASGGNGGSGVSNSISGTAVVYGGGGGGGKRSTEVAGTGGNGGGGNGGLAGAGAGGTDGLGGGGGGGGAAAGGNGGSGIVIVRYLTTLVEDSSGNGNIGHSVSSFFANGKVSGARAFATGKYVLIDDANSLDITSAITLEAWVRPDSLSGLQNIVCKRDLSTYNYCLRLTDDKFEFVFYGSSATHINKTTYSVMKVGEWQHVAAVYDSNRVLLYLNGVLQDSSCTTGTCNVAMTADTNPLAIGRAGSVDSQYFNGLIDEVRISNIARSRSAIVRSYLNGLGVTSGLYNSSTIDLGSQMSTANLSWTPSGVGTGNAELLYSDTGLFAQWNLNETSGTTAASGGSCGSSCNGTLTNFASTGSQDADSRTGWTASNKKWGAGSLVLDGANDYIHVGDKDSFDALTELSTCAWVKHNDISDDDHILSKVDNATWSGFMLLRDDVGQESGRTDMYKVWVDKDSAATAYIEGSSNSSKLGEWTYVCATFKANDTTGLRLYVNGVEDPHSPVSTVGLNSIDSGSANLVIGRYDPTAANYFNGIMDSVQVFSRVLPASEILSNYQAGNIQFLYRTSNNGSTWSDWESYGDGALRFGGSSYVLNSAPSNLPSGNVAKTIEGWVKFDSICSTTACNIGGFGSSSPDGSNFQVGTNSSGNLTVFGWGTSYTWDTGYSVSNILDSNYHLVTVTYNGTTTTLYVDGVSRATTTSYSWNTATTKIVIGNEIDESGQAMQGVIDSFRIYARALGSTEVSDNYAAPSKESPSNTTDMIAIWRFNEKSGNTAVSSGDCGIACNGTLTNFESTTSQDVSEVNGWTQDTGRGSNVLKESFDNGEKNWNTDVGYITKVPVETYSKLNTGRGSDGACSVSSGTTNLNTASCSGRGTADAVAFVSTALSKSGDTSITVSTTPTGLSRGDEVFILNARGATTNYGGTGLYETHIIYSISSNTLSFKDYPLKYTYDGTTQSIIVQRVPNYTSVSVSSGAVLTANAWDGTKGGVLFFRANGTVTNSGTISMDAKGYRGGIGGPSGAGSGGAGRGGEAFCAEVGGGSGPNTFDAVCGGGLGGGIYYSSTGGNGTPTGGAGGGGGLGGGDPDAYGGGGAGGGYGGPGIRGTGSGSGITGDRNVSGNGGNAGTRRGGGGGGGGTYGTSDLSRLYFGSGAGGGGAIWGNAAGGNGGAGGGIIYIVADTLNNGGVGIVSRGGNGGNYGGSGSYTTGPGGGGAGGSVKIEANTLSLGTNLVLVGGGSPGTASGYSAGAGGVGRVAVSYANSISGSVSSAPPFIRKTNSMIKQEGQSSVKITSGSYATDSYTVGIWNLEESSGSSAFLKDASGYGQNATPSGTSYVQGKVGGARSFNGSSDYVSVTSTTALNLTSAYTLEAWINPASATGTQRIVSKWANGVGGYFMTFSESGGATPRCVAATTTNGYRDASRTVPLNKWSHIACVYNGTAINLYIDGVLSNGTAGGTVPASMAASGTNLFIGSESASTNFFNGLIDEVRVSNINRTAREIAESYALGSYTYINRSFNPIDLSLVSFVPISIAADRPGSYITATVGESNYVNYQEDASTVALWRLDQATGSGAYLRDMTVNELNATPSGTSYVQGKVGGARSFNGSSDYVSVTSTTALNLTSAYTLEAWINPASATGTQRIVSKWANGVGGYFMTFSESGGATPRCVAATTTNGYRDASRTVPLNKWSHIACVYNGSTIDLYIDGVLANGSSGGTVPASMAASGTNLFIGSESASTNFFNGLIDEVRVSSIARSRDEIRQVYEMNLRSHKIAITFGASLQSGNLISDINDTSFTIDATKYGAVQYGSGIVKGEKIVVKENYNGVEYIAQGEVSYVDIDTGNVTLSSWESSSTFPSGGYTANADVFKWQTEYLPITSRVLPSHRDAITLLSLYISDGDEGRNIWVDNLRSSMGHLKTSSTEMLLFPSNTRYVQYKAIFTTEDPNMTPFLSAVQLDYSGDSNGPTMDQIMRHGKWFNNGQKEKFWWTGN